MYLIWQAETAWRTPTSDEQQLIAVAMRFAYDSARFEDQVKHPCVRVGAVGDDYWRLEFQRGTELEVRLGAGGTVTDLIAPDADGVPIMLLMFHRAGQLLEIELIRADGLKIVKLPEPGEFFEYDESGRPR
jgi:hypothetical protein